ncbi:MAG: hypothetical protein J5647_09560 [Spirochaetaceae bacterium]|nr:hypothetical protein [Spirochaetaceae bacterium]
MSNDEKDEKTMVTEGCHYRNIKIMFWVIISIVFIILGAIIALIISNIINIKETVLFEKITTTFPIEQHTENILCEKILDAKWINSVYNVIETKEITKVNFYPFFIIFVVLFFMMLLSFLLIHFFKDKDYLKLSKSEKLTEIKEQLLKKETDNLFLTTTETTIISHCLLNKGTTTTKEENKPNRADLLKHYMTCITEL